MHCLTPQVNEMPGTYFYHDHSNHNRGDGLQGALIVNERPGTPQLFEADAEETLFLSDWWHFAGNSMALRLNRWGSTLNPRGTSRPSASAHSWVCLRPGQWRRSCHVSMCTCMRQGVWRFHASMHACAQVRLLLTVRAVCCVLCAVCLQAL